MKKNIGMLALIVYSVCFIPACTNPPIFAAIEQEIKLKPATIKSFVYKIVQFDKNLFVANGALFKKTLGVTGKWENISGPDGRCIGLAADKTHLYGLFENNGVFRAYYTDATAKNWTKVENLEVVHFIAGTETIFAANKDTKQIYILKDGEAVPKWKWDGDVLPLGAAGTYCLLGNGLYTEAGQLVRETPTKNINGICEGPDHTVFVLASSHLYCFTGSKWQKISHNVESPQSITYLPSKQLVLIGGKNGYGEIKLTAGTNLEKAMPVSAGAKESSIPQNNYHQYKNSVGKWLLNPIMAFDYGNADNSGYIIYAGVLDSNATYSGLWGFYYDQQLEWNRE